MKVIRSASQPTYDLDADPDLSAYLSEDTPDQDLVTETGYDPQGRVMYAQDALGRRTWNTYDGLGRTVRTVHNAVGSATDGGAHDPRSPHYHPVLNLSDRDQIALTEYDLDGRVLWTQDYLGRRTWIAYDGLGRTVRTITHAVGTATDGSPSDPRSPVYLTSAEPDRDLVSHTRYDSQGRVAATVDTLGNETRYTYDVLGRRITTVTNFVTGNYEPQHPDRDLLSQTVYDRAGRVVETIDPRGTRTTFVYDRLGRRISSTTAAGTALATTDYTCYNRGGQVQRIIRNYRPGPTDPPPDALEEPREGWSHTFDFTRSAEGWVSNYWGAYEPGTGFKTENKSDAYGTFEAVDPVITFPQAVTLTRIEMYFNVTGRGGSPYGNDGDYFYADCNRPGGCPPAFPHLAFWHLLGDSVSPRVWTGRT
ncbi:MAG: RHS repeat protein, partial [Anaerolineae bacterium]|nr:RHS repeat protein [Anaerolineae bacterium]